MNEQEQNEWLPMSAWLNEYQNPKTKSANETSFKFFCSWAKTTPKQLLDNFDQIKAKSQLLAFQNYLVNDYKTPKGESLKPNSVRFPINAVRAFYSSQKEPIRGLKKKTVKAEAAKGEHIFSIADLRAMYAVADTRNKAILSTATSLGWDVSSFGNLERDFVENLVKRTKSQNSEFIAFDWQRKKTGATVYGILNPMAIFSLDNYIMKLNKESPNQTKLFDLTELQLNNILKNLATEANIVLIGRVHFHLLRKYLMNALSDAGLNAWEVKIIVGKEIPVTDSTYLQTLKKSAYEKYQKAYPTHLSLSQMVNGNAKYNILTDLVVSHVKAQKALIEFMEQNGMLSKVPPQIQEQLKSVYEFAKIMETQNGKKQEPKEEHKESEEP
ncbi:MAG: hypothetical protein ABSC20_00705 [Candidatus Bathyarchaeia archaeon]|jgi:integrase